MQVKEPDHSERPADKQPPPSQEWDRIAEMDEFKRLTSTKRRFIIPATIFFIVYYFLLPVLVGYAPKLMETKVFGVLNLAYVFALSQFFVAWLIAALYVRAANKFDQNAKEVISKAAKEIK